MSPEEIAFIVKTLGEVKAEVLMLKARVEKLEAENKALKEAKGA